MGNAQAKKQEILVETEEVKKARLEASEKLKKVKYIVKPIVERYPEVKEFREMLRDVEHALVEIEYGEIRSIKFMTRVDDILKSAEEFQKTALEQEEASKNEQNVIAFSAA